MSFYISHPPCIDREGVILSKKWRSHFFEFFARRRVTRLRREKYFLRRTRKGYAASVRRQSRQRLRSTRRRRKWFYSLSRLRERLGETFKGKLPPSLYRQGGCFCALISSERAVLRGKISRTHAVLILVAMWIHFPLFSLTKSVNRCKIRNVTEAFASGKHRKERGISLFSRDETSREKALLLPIYLRSAAWEVVQI